MDVWLHTLSQTLLHSFWQIGVIALCVASASKFIPGKNAATRYLCALIGIYLTPLCFVLTFIYIGKTTVPAFGDNSMLSAGVSRALVLAWALGLGFHGLKLASHWRGVFVLTRSQSNPPPGQINRIFTRLRDRLSLASHIKLRVSTQITSPSTVGFFRPIVLMPIACLSHLSIDEIEAILAHELAHIARGDFLHKAMQAMVECLFFYHPGIYYLSRCADQEREHACDDRAAALIKSPKSLATGLLQVGLLNAAHNKLILNAVAHGALEHRVSRLVTLAARRVDDPVLPRRRPWFLSLLVGAILSVSLWMLSLPLFAAAGSLRMDKSTLISLKDDVCAQIWADNIYFNPKWDTGWHVDLVHKNGLVYMNGTELPQATQRAVKKIYDQYGLTIADASRLRYYLNDIKLTLKNPDPSGQINVEIFELENEDAALIRRAGTVTKDQKCDCKVVALTDNTQGGAGIALWR